MSTVKGPVLEILMENRKVAHTGLLFFAYSRQRYLELKHISRTLFSFIQKENWPCNDSKKSANISYFIPRSLL